VAGIIRIISLCWLVFLLGFGIGVYIWASETWPYPALKALQEFIAGHPEEETSVLQKLKSDFDIKPERHLAKIKPFKGIRRKAARPQEGLRGPLAYPTIEVGFVPNERAWELEGLPLRARREKPRIFLSGSAPRGYRAIYGVFDFLGSRHGVILLDPRGKVVRVWKTTQEVLPWWHPKDVNIYPHGFEIDRDGSIFVAFDGGTSLIKYDYCGRMLWAIKGGFHHSIDLDGSGALWTWGDYGVLSTYGRKMVRIDSRTGKLLRQFHLMDVINANPEVDVLGILQEATSVGSVWMSADLGVIWHVNDVEALPKELEPYYPGFKAGDLLVTVRSPDLVFVMDPETLKIKWWRQGLTRRPHDADFNGRGTITIFDNNMHRGYSRIVEIDPVSFKHRTIVQGRRYDFYTEIRGKHQLLPNGGVLITSTGQGRVFEVDASGNVVFEFLNIYGVGEDGTMEYLNVSEAKFLHEDYFTRLPRCD